MKKIYIATTLVFLAWNAGAQRILSVSPYTIPSSGTFTLTLTGHQTFFLSHPISYVRLTQPHNSDGSIFTSTSETVLSDDSITATFTVTNPAHGGFYDVTIYASGIYINTRLNGVYMTGVEPRRISSITPDHGTAGTVLTTSITGAQMHFLSSTGYPHIGYLQLRNEIDNSAINNSTITYIDSNNVNVDFNIPSYATNGKYSLNIDLQNLNQTNRTGFFTVTGGTKKRIISVTPHQALHGDTAYIIVHVTGRNLVINPVYSATLSSHLTSYAITIYSQNIYTIDSNHVRLRIFVPNLAPDGDYKLTLGGTPMLMKNFAFRIVPPDIRGIVFLDTDSNGVMNGPDHGIGNRKVLLLPDSIIALTDANGNYFYYCDPGNYTLQTIADTQYVLTTLPATYAVTVFDTAQAGFNFGLFKLPTFEHLFSVYSQTMRCNWQRHTYWTITNPEDITHQGTVTLIHSSNLTFISSSLPPSYSNGDTVVWNYSINPLGSLQCDIVFLVPSQGQTVWYTLVDEIATHQYHRSLSTVVSCSYDPNDKSVQPEETPANPTTLNTEELEYKIRFQNTGTDTAFQVVIADTLSPYLDLLTFDVIGSSHNVVTTIDFPNRIVTFSFENILLPDSNVDEPGSNGYVIYRIKALQGIPDSVTVSNTAYIYFDFNEAIITNTATSHLVYFHLPLAAFSIPSTSICQLNCIDFTSNSIYSTSFEWSFPGGIPSSSTDENPQGICYLNTGTYDVTLIATNGFGSDTVLIPNYITVNVLPPPPVLYASNDTIFCVPDPLHVAYQWYDTTGMIPGATNNFYVPPFTGLFGLSVYNQEGCEAASSIPIAVGIQHLVTEEIHLYPNPAENILFINNNSMGPGVQIEITNSLGEQLMLLSSSHEKETSIDIRNLSPGIYFVRIGNQEKTAVLRFVRN